MIKRMNKITALLAVAASVISIMPVMAADTTKLTTNDGSIENAISYKDGKYLYEGYKSADADQGIYYNSGDADKLLEDVEDGDVENIFGEQYVYVDDSDEYLVDLSDGTVTDDTPSDLADTVGTKLKSNLKKTDRYGTVTPDSDNLIVQDTVTGSKLLPGNKFGENWYQYAVAVGSDGTDDTGTNNSTLYGFINGSGKYIDICNLANIYAYSSLKEKFVKIEEFSSDTDSNTKLSAVISGQPEVLTQDADNIYVKVKVVITDTNNSTSSTQTYIQKISKAQGDQKDEAYIPKSVASYSVTDKFDSDESDDAAEVIGSTTLTKYSVVGSQLLAIEVDGDEIEVTTINLKKDKVEYDDSSKSDSKLDVYLAEKDDSDSIDGLDDDSDAITYDIDVNGNVWVIQHGSIYKFANNEFTEVYSVDSSLNSINVYDEKNLIAWDTDGDIYTTASGVTKATLAAATTAAQTTAPEVTVASDKKGWDKLSNGTWNYYDATGVKVTNNWINDAGVWYYLKADGAMATGWLNDNGTWYYLNASGAMLLNTTVDGYTLGASGAWIK